MALGQPLIAPRGVTFREITGDEDRHYDWLFSNKAEQKSIVIEAIQNKQKRTENGAMLREFVLDHFSHEAWAERWDKILAEVEYVDSRETPQATLDGIRKAVTKTMTLHEAKNCIYRMKVGNKTPLSNQSCPTFRMVKMLRRLGYTFRLHRGERIVVPPKA